MAQNPTSSKLRFCSECGTQFLSDALFCHNCGAPAGGGTSNPEPAGAVSPLLRWGLPVAAIIVLIALSFYRLGSSSPTQVSEDRTPLASGAITPPDISAMSPEERANRLFNRVMQMWSEGKSDSAAFFAPMALSAIESLTPLTLHSRYDMGLVALASGDVAKAGAQSDTILKASPTHLLGLALSARVADARGDAAAAKAARQKLVAAEKSERAKGLPEYSDHDTDLRAAIDLARKN
jgi:hypothetical protein